MKAFSDDGLIFSVFAELHPKTNVPVKGCWICVVPICIMSFFLNFEQILKFDILGVLVSYTIINMSAIALRLRKKVNDD